MADVTLPDNPLKEYTTYSTYFILKLGKEYYDKTGNNKAGHETATLIVDSRGKAHNDKDNKTPSLIIQSFEVNHQFNSEEARVTVGLDATLVLYERGGCTYIQTLAKLMEQLGIQTTASAVFWIGVGIIGWKNTGSGFVEEPVTEKWFPFYIKDLDMDMKNSGSEYNHWLKGISYSRADVLANDQLNIKETVGNTLKDHLDDLMKNANQEMEKTKKGNKNGTVAGLAKFKTIKFSYDVDPEIAISSPIETNTVSYDTGGAKHISSGGKNGSTTVINHIDELLKHTPLVLNDLKNKSMQYKIIARPKSIDENTEELVYHIRAYNIDPVGSGKTPLMRLNYFYGGVNEDIIDFSFNIKGAFHMLTQGIITKTREDISADPDRIVDQNSKNVDSSKTPTTPESVRVEDTSATALVPQDHLAAAGINIPPKPIKNNFGNDMNRSAAEAWGIYDNGTKQAIGQQLVDNSIKIRGNPLLILDDDTITKYDLEGAVNIVVLNVGTPLPDFQDQNPSQDAPVEQFIFSGPYMIRYLKSIFGQGGTFQQEIHMTISPDKAKKEASKKATG